MKTYIECRNCKFYKYCQDWSYLPNQNSGTDRHTFCMYPDNIRPDSSSEKIIFKSAPSIININHDCSWFQKKENINTFVWDSNVKQRYRDHGPGTFNINPVNGVKDFYIGEKNLETIIQETSGGGSELETRVSALEIRVSGHDTNISTINTNISNIQIKVDGHDERMDEIESELDTFDSRIIACEDKVDKGIIQEGSWITGGNCTPVDTKPQ